MLFQILAVWGCMPEIMKDCGDMTNASSTYLSIALGAIIGVVITWWVYKMQKKTALKQDETLRHKIDPINQEIVLTSEEGRSFGNFIDFSVGDFVTVSDGNPNLGCNPTAIITDIDLARSSVKLQSIRNDLYVR
jgi:hypothetical protein